MDCSPSIQARWEANEAPFLLQRHWPDRLNLMLLDNVTETVDDSIVLRLPDWPADIFGGHCRSFSACPPPGETSLPLLASQWKPPPWTVQGECLKRLSVYICVNLKKTTVNLIRSSVCFSQGYERVRRNSEEELYLMRAHDMEEGSSHSDLSSSGENTTEEVKTAQHLDQYPFTFNFPSSVTISDADEFCFSVATVWLCRWASASGHPHYRVLPGLCLQHSVLPEALGSEPGTCPWVWLYRCSLSFPHIALNTLMEITQEELRSVPNQQIS